MSTPAILYLSAEYDPSQKMMGRQVASSAFLSAVARYEPAEELAVAATSRDEVVRFRSLQRSLGAPERRYRWIRWGEAEGLRAAGGLYRPDPVLGDAAFAAPAGALAPGSSFATGEAAFATASGFTASGFTTSATAAVTTGGAA